MYELKGFKPATTLVLELKKIESDDETKYGTFRPWKLKQLSMNVLLMMSLNHSVHYDYIKYPKISLKNFGLDY